jgi:hypothetical protein
MNKYIEKQNRLKKKATGILKESGLLKLLNKFGEVSVIGSYAYDLMTWEDIDIHVQVKKIDYESIYKIVKILFSKENTYKIALQDFRKSIFPNRPHGLYFKLILLEKPKTFWKIDIWFFSNEDKSIEFVDWVKSNITKEKREIILKIKNELGKRLTDSSEISGSQVVRAVLKNNVKNTMEFEKYLDPSK